MGVMQMALLHLDTGLDNCAQVSILPHFSEEVGATRHGNSGQKGLQKKFRKKGEINQEIKAIGRQM